jgi:hypothetical protein
VFNPAHDIDDQKSPWEYFEKLGCHFAFRSTTDNENPIMVCIILPPAGQATSSLLKTSPVGLHVSQAPVLRWIVFCGGSSHFFGIGILPVSDTWYRYF